MFASYQIDFMKNNGFNIDFDKKLSDEDLIYIEQRASYLLQTQGFDENYIPTHLGEMCETIIDAM